MRKVTTLTLDSLLREIDKRRNGVWYSKSFIELAQKLEIPNENMEAYISILIDDGYLERLVHPSAPDTDFGVYTISKKGIRFINLDGGYTKNRRKEYYENQNLKFTFFRHWIWFIGFLVSLAANVFFLIRILNDHNTT